MSQAANCCAEFYEKDWVQSFMGDSFHPGGIALSRRLIESLGLGPQHRVLDIASGTGATAIATRQLQGSNVVGIDLSQKNVDAARRRVQREDIDNVGFERANAEALPFDDESFDAVICECAFSTFEDKATVAREFARVLKPGGRLGLSDMCVCAPLPETLAQAIGPWACLQDALDVEGYQRAFLDAGLRITGYHDESEALIELALDLKRKLVLTGLGQMAGALGELDLDLESARSLLDEARDQVRVGNVQYARMSFSRGRPQPYHAQIEPAASTPCDPSTGCC